MNQQHLRYHSAIGIDITTTGSNEERFISINSGGGTLDTTFFEGAANRRSLFL